MPFPAAQIIQSIHDAEVLDAIFYWEIRAPKALGVRCLLHTPRRIFRSNGK